MSRLFSIFRRAISTSNPPRSPLRNTINVAFGKYIFYTNTLSSGALMFVGDIVQQEFEYQQNKLPKRYDFGRLARMFLVGIGMGPVHHYYYIYLNKVLPRRDMKTITTKVMLDQFIMSPICIAQFFYSIGLLEMRPLDDCTKELRNKFPEVYLMDWCFWPPTQYFNFYFVPDKYQVFYINVATMLYNIFLSYIKHREQAETYKEQLALKQT